MVAIVTSSHCGRRSAKARRASSSDLLIALIAEAEKLCPHNASVTAFTPAFAGAGTCGRHALHVHLRQGADQRLLRTLIALEQLGRKTPVAILRHPKLQRPYPSDQRSAVIAA